ncbi:MAG: glutamate--tRNA ligase family protein [Deltaproteobacteria bacterium]|nr:glutamate--tRNA ligase family protein [Deltaproteobacteria bacterium]
MLNRGLAYRCYCTAEELEEERRRAAREHRPPRYSGRCRELSADDVRRFEREGRRPAIRFRVPDRDVTIVDALRGEIRFRAIDQDDFIIRRSDETVSFLLAGALDDADMRVTHVLRGDDHLPNTPRQAMLLQALDRGLPAFAHLGLVLDADHRPLSKRDGAATLADLRDAAYLPDAVRAALAHLGWSPPRDTGGDVAALAFRFRLEAVSGSSCVWDAARLEHENARALRALTADALAALCRDRGWIPPALEEPWRRALAAVQPELKFLAEIPHLVAPLLPGDVNVENEAREHLSGADVATALRVFAEEMENGRGFSDAVKIVKTKSGLTGRRLFQTAARRADRPDERDRDGRIGENFGAAGDGAARRARINAFPARTSIR